VTAASDLYQRVVLDHGKRPRNVGRLAAAATHVADGENPLCGDALHLEIACADDRLTALRFDGESCLLATASASLMTERLAGCTVTDARAAIAVMERLCGDGDAPGDEDLGELRAFAAVHRHPVRVQCATLPWRTLARALAD
jgi:nitrogen fixation NifU-like protein